MRNILRLYYPRIEIEGGERIPSSGAGLFVANHPNSLMDPALIGFATQRPVHFFAKAPLFDVPVFGALPASSFACKRNARAGAFGFLTRSSRRTSAWLGLPC